MINDYEGMHPGEKTNGVRTKSLEEFSEGPIEKAGGQGKETNETW